MIGLAEAFAARGVVAEQRLAGGHRNAVFLVRRGSERLVAKTTRHSEAGLYWLVPVFRAAEQAGLAFPRLIADDQTQFGRGGITLEPFVEGATARESDLAQLAPRIRRFHALARRIGPRPGGVSSMQLPPVPRRIGRVARNAVADLPLAAHTIVHGDVGPANILMSGSGPVVIDWDEARRDHPAFGLPLAGASPVIRRARLAWEVVSGWAIEPAYARQMARRLPRYPACPVNHSGSNRITPTAPARARFGSSVIGMYSPRRHNSPRSS